MHTINEQVISLATGSFPVVASLYMPTVKETRQNRIRFSNLLKELRQRHTDSGIRSHDLKLRIEELETAEADQEFWQHTSAGVAFFLTESEIVTIKTPYAVKELTAVGTKPMLTQVLPLISQTGKYFVLTLSASDIKLYEATRDSIGKRYLGDIPLSMKEFYDYDNLETHLTHLSSGNNLYTGKGSGEEEQKLNLEQFFNQVENGITQLLKGESAPLILAGVEYLCSIYKKVNRYPNLRDEIVEGSPLQTTKEDLHKKSWEIMDEYIFQRQTEALMQLKEQMGTGKASAQLVEVVTASFGGKVDQLFVANLEPVWGEYIEASAEVLEHDSRSGKSMDLISLAASETLKAGGSLVMVDQTAMPDGQPIAAIFRY